MIETSKKEVTIKRRIGQVQFDLLPENIERIIQLQDTTKTEEARESRRITLENKRNALQNFLLEIETSRPQITENF